MNKPQGQLKSSIMYTIAVIAANAVPVITLPIFTRVLSKEDFGLLALSEIYAVFMAGIVFLGSSIAFDRNYIAYEQDKIRRSQLVYSILAFVFFNFVVALSVSVVFIHQISYFIFHLPGLGILLILDLCGTFFAQILDLFLALFRNRQEPRIYLNFSVINCAAYLILSLILLLGFHWSIYGILWAKLCSSFIMAAWLMARVWKLHPFSFSFEVLKESWKISLPLTPRIFLGVFSSRIDRYMINLLGTLGGVGIYSIGQKIGYLVFAFENALENVFQPNLYKQLFQDPVQAKEKVGEYLFPFFYASAGFALLVSIFSAEAIGIFFPKSYEAVTDIIIIFSAYYVILFFSKIASLQLIYLKKTYLTSIVLLFTYFINIIVSIFLIKCLGANGAALATLVTGIVSTAIALGIAQSFFKIKWPCAKLALVFMVFIVGNLMAWFLSHVYIHWSMALGLKLCCVAGYVFLGFKMSVFDLNVMSREIISRFKK